MSYRLSILSEEDRDLVVESLRAAATQRTRVARKASGTVAADRRAGKDVRRAAVKVTALLAEADVLESLAEELERAVDVPALVTDPAALRAALQLPEEPTEPTEEDLEGDDGTSEAAQALAALADLKPAKPDDEDPDTGALPEDEPADDDVEEVQL